MVFLLISSAGRYQWWKLGIKVDAEELGYGTTSEKKSLASGGNLFICPFKWAYTQHYI